MKRIIVAEMIKAFRTKNKLTQKQLGALLGVSAQAVSKWEKEDCYPDITFLPDIASVLNCSINDFFV